MEKEKPAPEEQLKELRKELLSKVEDKLLDEYTYLYMNTMLRHTASLKINFDNVKESKEMDILLILHMTKEYHHIMLGNTTNTKLVKL